MEATSCSKDVVPSGAGWSPAWMTCWRFGWAARMPGTVYDLPAREGAYLNAGDAICSIGKLEPVRVRPVARSRSRLPKRSRRTGLGITTVRSSGKS